MSKKFYTVQSKGGDTWLAHISATACTMQWCKGFAAAMKETYPCNDIRIVEYGSEEIIEEIPGNSIAIIHGSNHKSLSYDRDCQNTLKKMLPTYDIDTLVEVLESFDIKVDALSTVIYDLYIRLAIDIGTNSKLLDSLPLNSTYHIDYKPEFDIGVTVGQVDITVNLNSNDIIASLEREVVHDFNENYEYAHLFDGQVYIFADVKGNYDRIY